MTEETEKDRDIRLRLAERAHDQDAKWFEMHTKQIEAFSTAAMKAPALVAAGGVAAGLGFYSANFARLSPKPEAVALFNESLSWMLVGLLFTLISPGLAYFSQLAYSDSVMHREHHFFPPYSRNSKRSKIGQVIGDVCRWACVLSVALAVVSVAGGGLKFLDLVASLSKS